MTNYINIRNSGTDGAIQYNGVDQLIISANGVSIPSNKINSIVPPGTIIDFASNTTPTGFLTCPTTVTLVSTTTYAALFAAIGYTYGGSGASFGLPYFPVGYVAAHNTSSAGSQTTGQIIAHNHTIIAYFGTGDGGGQNYHAFYSNQDGLVNTSPQGPYAVSLTGGSSNLAAAVYTRKCVKY